jgi:phosphatidylserine/phosphatidylglycerophosphate/cardiolipin synthase-like enzyme
MQVDANKSGFTIKAHIGDAKTLLAFNLPKAQIKNLAGFTLACTPPGQPSYYIYNKLQFKDPSQHAQNKTEPGYSSINAPIQKFRWLHVPGNFKSQIVKYGIYTYAVTPRYFDDKGSLLALESDLTLEIKVNVAPFEKKTIQLGFTRGFVQSQAFEQHFGNKLVLQPATRPLTFPTNQTAGKNADGQPYTYLQEYNWSGFTARERIFSLLKEVEDDGLSFDVFAYDLNEPDIVAAFLKLAAKGKIRMILDNAALHLAKKNKKTGKITESPEDLFTSAFNKARKGGAEIKRGKFSRFSHDKVIILKKGDTAVKVLTGSTNFSVTGVYVNSNHLLIFEDSKIAALYADVFAESWKDNVKTAPFEKASWATKSFHFPATNPTIDFAFSPHDKTFATEYLGNIASRITKEKSSVLFAVMDTGPKSSGPIFPALRALHADQKIFSYGISDNPGGITLYKPSSKTGVIVTGKPVGTKLPPPFNQEVGIGLGHQIHHKFVVCGFNTVKAEVFCGSSNLALGGEQANGDNLISIRDEDIATVFALEALALVDHFHFRNANQTVKKKSGKKPVITKKPLFLYQNNKWAVSYFDSNDFHYVDRMLFS